MNTQLQPHDLLWGMTPAMLPQNAPEWVAHELSREVPVVIRRASTRPAVIAVGIRGKCRSLRYATEMPVQAIIQHIKPEALVETDLAEFPHLQKSLELVGQVMESIGLPWGYTGSTGFELATGLRTVTEQSDIDLLIRAECLMEKEQARTILQQLDALKLKIDVQLQTPSGGIALREWAQAAGSILLKHQDGAVLVLNPWKLEGA